MAHIDCTPDSEGNFVRLIISFTLLILARFTEFIKETEIVTEFVVKLFQIGAYGATIGVFIFTVYKHFKEKSK
jgi:hypothetical protein